MRGFPPRQRLILALLTTAVVVVFGLLGYSIWATLRYTSTSPLSTPTALEEATPLTPSSLPETTVVPSPPGPPTPTRPVPLSQIQNARAVREIGRIVASLRELPPVEQFPVSFPTEREIALYLLQQYSQDRPQENLHLYSLLGLVPRLDPLPLPDVTGQAAGTFSLYLPEGRQILLVAGRGPATPEDELALAHTLAHALQDNAFGTGRGGWEVPASLAAACRSTPDAALALRALVEGDAILTAARYAGLEKDPEGLARLARIAARAEEPAYAALANLSSFEAIRHFPYTEGARFVAALYAEGGWEAVNRAYAVPPCTTQEILHPERYRNRRPVQDLVSPDLTARLGKAWRLERRETVGEFLIGLHLAAYLDSDALAWRAADGWSGDTLALWADGIGREVVVWRLAWESREEAVEFERAYRLLIPHFRTPPLLATEPPLGLKGDFWAGPSGAAYLARAGRVVTVVWGPDLETVAAVVPALP
ncbi:MAG: hypothetical protein N3B68_12225 [Anaerolineae bacterium]|nr:hypothetical protein [Anaerolineae bacterium]